MNERVGYRTVRGRFMELLGRCRGATDSVSTIEVSLGVRPVVCGGRSGCIFLFRCRVVRLFSCSRSVHHAFAVSAGDPILYLGLEHWNGRGHSRKAGSLILCAIINICSSPASTNELDRAKYHIL